MKIEDETGVANPADKVTRLPVRFKEPPDPDRVLVGPYEVGKPRSCDHLMVQYVVSVSDAEVECSRCGGKLNPMWVLAQLATTDRRFFENAQAAKATEARRQERRRTKCENCGKMTRIRNL